MTDAAYMRAWRQKRKEEKSDSTPAEPKIKAREDRAGYMRQWRANRAQMKVKPTPPSHTLFNDDALNEVVLKRGKVLTEMMRTPPSMWPAEWFDE